MRVGLLNVRKAPPPGPAVLLAMVTYLMLALSPLSEMPPPVKVAALPLTVQLVIVRSP